MHGVPFISTVYGCSLLPPGPSQLQTGNGPGDEAIVQSCISLVIYRYTVTYATCADIDWGTVPTLKESKGLSNKK